MIKKAIMVLFLLVIVSTLLSFPLSLNCYSAPGKEVSELRTWCSKSAEEFFKNKWGKGIIETKNDLTIINYMYHYNEKMNKCFVILVKMHSTKKEVISNTKELWDVNKNENHGNFSKYVKEEKPSACIVENKRCYSEHAWDSLVRQYMEE